MDWNLGVPKVCHLYWDGSVMPYMRYLTAKSFIDLNPDWDVILWTPTLKSDRRAWTTRENSYAINCTDYYPEMLKLKLNVFEVDFEGFGFSNEMAEVHKSDYLRLYLLSTMGGLWSDMDVIFFKPMAKFYLNDPKYKEVDAWVCLNKHAAYIHSGGLLMSSPDSPYYTRLEELSHTCYKENDYQSIGVTMFNRCFPTLDKIREISKAMNIGMDVVYAHNANQIRDIIELNRPLFTENSIGIHWYAGHPMWEKFIRRTDGGRINLPSTVIGTVLMKYGTR